MRRSGLAGLVLALAGCTALRDAFSAHPTAAARAAGQDLTVERLAEVASRVKGMPLEQATLSRLANAYVDYMLFAMTLAQGESLEDSSVVARVMWPAVSQLKFNHFIERLSARHELNDRQIDSTYNAGELRAFQHILITVPPSAAPPVVQQKQAQINLLWRSLASSRGTKFAAVAKRSSEDPGSKISGGYLDVSGRGRLVPQFEDAAWQLAPGGMSGVVRSSYGFHIIRRPPLAEIRDTFAAGLQHVVTSRFDSTFFADLAKQRDIRIVGGAGEAIRNALQDLEAAGRSDQRLARFTGGTFRMKDLVRWLYSVDPRYVQQIPMATDSQIGLLVQQMVVRTVALQQAESAKVQVTASEWAEIRTGYDSSLTILRSLLQLDSATLRDSASTADGRVRLSMAHVRGYFDRVVGGQAQFFPIPPLLAQVLREQSKWWVDPSGVRRAAERAVALRAGADSLQPPGAGNRGTGLRPAPGPAPLPPVSDSVLKRPPSRREIQ